MSDALSDQCSRDLQRHDPDRWLTALFAPDARRPGLFALYAFNAEIARVRESVSQPIRNTAKPQPVMRVPRLDAVISAAMVVATGATQDAIISMIVRMPERAGSCSRFGDSEPVAG